MNSLNVSVANIFKRILANGNRNILRDNVNNSLLDLLEQSQNETQYIANLTKQIVLNIESTKASCAILHQFINNGEYPHLPVVHKSIKKTQATINRNMPNLLPVYTEEMKIEQLDYDKVTQLEIYYTTSLLELQLFFDFFNSFGSDTNKELFEALFHHPAQEVGKTVLAYISTYSTLLFKKELST
ncbi:hypothetical protein LCL96_18025 [Rossellomorea aquimaris]|uniref:hypothetical protein n=1 Tax=Rossellomorea aquimaris TaxID=189382 RepID=UPI001CD2C3F1|nr:hypothetical protein [Rossellomorea aquimaris]MCA1060815.1 hypothetical protein [Rossellomorea aquimaris]